jgi:hypothetical protein
LLAQLVEQLALNQLVGGSNPSQRTKNTAGKTGVFLYFGIVNCIKFGIVLNMSYLLITGILFVVLPILVVEFFAHAFFFGMLKDDSDTAGLMNFVLGLIFFGLLLIAVHFIFV